MKLLILLLSVFAAGSAKAQTSDSTNYPLVIQFNSECCGVPDATPVKNFIKSFRKKNKLKIINALHIGPMGREGEYWLAFTLTEMNSKQAAAFYRQLETVVKKLKKPGYANVVRNLTVNNNELSGRTSVEKVLLK